jgi:small-conductance mechanosensitive channel/CRP-like cAMP-binding protein
MGVAALAVTLIVSSITTNRLVKRKLRLSIFLLIGYVLFHLALIVRPELVPELTPPGPDDLRSPLRGFERLALSAAIINLLVLSLINPLRKDRVPEGFPAIMQDAIVIGLLMVVGTFVFKEQLLTTSAVGAVVVGFALQDTLGNAFAGLAIQSEKPFHVGHWIRVSDFEGRVAEVTWRATKLRTRSGSFIILPNNIVAKEAITNYSEPVLPTRLELEVGVAYQAAPPVVKAAMLEAIGQARSVLPSPAPDVLLVAFDASTMNYRARFWIEDYEFDDEARDEVRTAIHYAFARRGIEIPYPIQIEYSRDLSGPTPEALQQEREEVLRSIDIFAAFDDHQRASLAATTAIRLYGDGEAVVRQGAPGDSMYVVCSGRVAVLLDQGGQEVATIEPGGYFGEMSLLTGEARSATVVARGETRVLELTASQFRKLGDENPQAVEQVGVAAVTRRAELDRARSAVPDPSLARTPATFLARMKKFLRLD